MKKTTNLKTKILSIMIPIIIVFIGTNTYLNYKQNKNLIQEKFKSEIGLSLKGHKDSVELQFDKFRTLAESVAIGVKNNYEIMSTYDLQSYLKELVMTDENIQGIGVWFDAIESKENRSFTTYVYKNNGTAVYSDEYNKVDYSNDEWYVIGKEANGEVKWTRPYYDSVMDEYIVTVVVPLLDNGLNFKGVVTADISIENITTVINEIQIGETGEMFLIDNEGYYISNKDIQKIKDGKNILDEDSGLENIAEDILSNSTDGGTFESNEGKKDYQYKEIPGANWKLVMTINSSELTKLIRVQIIEAVLIGAGIILIMSIAITLIVKNIVSNIEKVNELSEKLAEGDFTSNIDVNSQDEIGKMTKNLNFMINNLKEIIEVIRGKIGNNLGAAQELAAISEQSKVSSDKMKEVIKLATEGAENQNILINQSSMSMNEMKNGIESITINIQEINNMSGEAKEQVRVGIEDLKLSTNSMNQINSTVKNFAEQFKELNYKSNEIDDIIKLISEIAEKTNLLALNAAIEAARAGEQGKGFAVVADEVRKLAEQSRESSVNVIKLINEIKKQISDLSYNVGESLRCTEEGTQKIQDTNISYERISYIIDDLSKRINGISLVIEELSISSNNISESMENIEVISNSSLNENRSAEEDIENLINAVGTISEAAEELSLNAEEMEKAINKFKL